MVNYKKQGKKNRTKGARFERKVRADLEDRGWTVDRWSNNVEFMCQYERKCCAKLVAAKSTRFRSNTHGFPDFVCIQDTEYFGMKKDERKLHEVIGVECKYNSYLSKEEKEKCRWLLDNNKFSKILIASYGGKDPEDRRKRLIKYEDFEEKYGKNIKTK